MNNLPIFVSKYREFVKKKNSVLCVGVDPAIPEQRKTNVLSNSNRIQFMKEIIEQVADYANVIKINRQYIIGLTIEDIQEINELIHQNRMLSIIDHKLSDIGSTNESALFWFKKEGFDAFTFSPFAGNVLETTQTAHKQNLGLFVLTLMSNPQAIIQKNAQIDEKPYYIRIAEMCNEANSDGCVIGVTGNVQKDDLEHLSKVLSPEKLILAPGIGPQGGDAKLVADFFKTNILVNVGRAIIYSERPAIEAMKYRDLLNSLL